MDEVDLGFKTGGQVTKTNVAVGDTVKAGGSGLGLAVAKSSVEMHKGMI